MFFFFEFHFYFFHLFANAFVWRNLAGFEEHPDAENEEEAGRKKVGDLFWDEGRDCMAENGGEDSHGD